MLILKLIPAPPPEQVYRVSVHKTGKLGLTAQAAKAMNIESGKSILLFVNAEESYDNSLYGKVVDGKNPQAFKITKAGEYFSIHAAAFFNAITFDFVKYAYTYSLSKIAVDNEEIIKFQQLSRKEREVEIDDLPF